jgi:hypothetical protein
MLSPESILDLPIQTSQDIIGQAPSVDQLYRETQVALASLKKIAQLLERIASTMPPDDR